MEIDTLIKLIPKQIKGWEFIGVQQSISDDCYCFEYRKVIDNDSTFLIIKIPDIRFMTKTPRQIVIWYFDENEFR